jgi:hypothetical protein
MDQLMFVVQIIQIFQSLLQVRIWAKRFIEFRKSRLRSAYPLPDERARFARNDCLS